MANASGDGAGDKRGVSANASGDGDARKYGVVASALGNGDGPKYGVLGTASGDGGSKYGVFGSAGGTGTNYAGYFAGNVRVTGTLSKGGGTFLIDHPLDPLNKVLRHNFVESPENLCLYRGKVKLDDRGQAVVSMPEYFAALTKQNEATVILTPLGKKPFPASYTWKRGHEAFTIFGEAEAAVSYLVLADRDDPVIKQLAKPVEEEKSASEKGRLLYPEAYGYPKEQGIDAAIEAEIAEPDIREPALVEPEILKPPAIEPEILKPPVIEPEILKPPVIEPEILKPPAIEPEILKPPVIEPEIFDTPEPGSSDAYGMAPSALERRVDEVSGVGPASARRLAESGVTNLAELAAMEPGQLSEVLEVSEERATGFIKEARRLLGES
jgi:predicted flap endonuclease-1-like 5' DNA nuclease